jgi:hypothetical protein
MRPEADLIDLIHHRPDLFPRCSTTHDHNHDRCSFSADPIAAKSGRNCCAPP